MSKLCIGDGVYVESNDFFVILTTSDGEAENNRICLDNRTMDALVEYYERIKQND